MNSNPGTHNGMAGLEKGIHRSTDRVHSEMATTSLSRNGAAACLYREQPSPKAVLVSLVEKY
jgi:hypothetical protein